MSVVNKGETVEVHFTGGKIIVGRVYGKHGDRPMQGLSLQASAESNNLEIGSAVSMETQLEGHRVLLCFSNPESIDVVIKRLNQLKQKLIDPEELK